VGGNPRAGSSPASATDGKDKGRRMKTIPKQNVQLHTATAQLKMITVDKQKITLAVFRQLPHKRLINEKLKYNGTPWGWVNYFWQNTLPDKVKRNLDYYKPMQVVWQKEGILFRSVVFLLPIWHELTGWHEYKEWCEHSSGLFDIDDTDDDTDDDKIDWLDKIQQRQERRDRAEKIRDKRCNKFAQNYNAVVEKLHAMDQLFIALGGGEIGGNGRY